MNVQMMTSVRLFMGNLNKPTWAKALRAVGLLEKFGSVLKMPHTKKIRPRLFELRIRGQLEVRIFYTFHQGEAWLLHAFHKKSQEIPAKELFAAEKALKSLDLI